MVGLGGPTTVPYVMEGSWNAGKRNSGMSFTGLSAMSAKDTILHPGPVAPVPVPGTNVMLVISSGKTPGGHPPTPCTVIVIVGEIVSYNIGFAAFLGVV